MRPGSLVSAENTGLGAPVISVMDYGPDHCHERDHVNISELKQVPPPDAVAWVNVIGVHDADIMAEIGQIFGVHPLTLEDIMNTGHRPKCEDFDSYLFITLKMLTFNTTACVIESEQVSLIVTNNCVITFQERPGDVFDAIRDRVRSGKGRVTKMKTDYLAYALIDAIVDNYFLILETIGDHIETLEADLLLKADYKAMKMVHHFKRELLFMRKAVWPLRDLINGTQRKEAELITDETVMYYRDIYDHSIQVIDTLEVYRDMIAGIQDVYLSSTGNRLNEIMKVLTLFAAIFIPLTFIAGIYGMNFDNMPELRWKWGYFGVLGVMVSLAAGMFFFFKKKKWL
ncbi:MAG: magnesium/cobalt transporter CorA [Lentisphaeria bacterium]|nr:magnesium/cobalt transporter CorA [Lentisphaeria bacterium]